jgi:formate hydrogenlyase subunit 6/NADH:ubiquinone oxidoreductase subunit I
MFGFLKQVGDYTRDAVDAARNLTQGLSVTFDHMKRRPVTVQYPLRKADSLGAVSRTHPLRVRQVHRL